LELGNSSQGLNTPTFKSFLGDLGGFTGLNTPTFKPFLGDLGGGGGVHRSQHTNI